MNERDIKLSKIAPNLCLEWFYASFAQEQNRTGYAPMLSQGHNRTGDEPMLGGDMKITTVKCSRLAAADFVWNSIHREDEMRRALTAFRYFFEELVLEL
jgi:hypothetical protein